MFVTTILFGTHVLSFDHVFVFSVNDYVCDNDCFFGTHVLSFDHVFVFSVNDYVFDNDCFFGTHVLSFDHDTLSDHDFFVWQWFHLLTMILFFFSP